CRSRTERRHAADAGPEAGRALDQPRPRTRRPRRGDARARARRVRQSPKTSPSRRPGGWGTRARVRAATARRKLLPRRAQPTSRRLDRARFDPMLCVTRWPPRTPRPDSEAAADAVESAGVRLLKLRRRATFDVLAWGSLERFLRRERIDVIHAHHFGSNLWAT